MASAPNDPRAFAMFLLDLQRAKVARGQKAFDDYRNTPLFGTKDTSGAYGF